MGRSVSRRFGVRTVLAFVAFGLVVLMAWLALRDGGQGLAALGGGKPLPADFYQLADPDTIIVTGVTGEGRWTRITNVIESSTEVRVAIRSLQWPGTHVGIGHQVHWTLNLRQPLGDRTVTDGFSELSRRE